MAIAERHRSCTFVVSYCGKFFRNGNTPEALEKKKATFEKMTGLVTSRVVFGDYDEDDDE